MGDVELGTLLVRHQDALRDMSRSLAAGDHTGFIDRTVGLVMTLATGTPVIGALAPFARKAVAAAFGNAADEMFRRELAALESEEERRELVEQIQEPIEALLGQALIQLVRVNHNVKDEVLAELGGVRADLAEFRAQFAAGLGGEAVRLDLQTVTGGALGVRVGANTKKRVFIARQDVSGAGSVGIVLD